jgi:hypothetical protein
MEKQELLNLFESEFRYQLGLEISDVVHFEDNRFILKKDIKVLFMGSLKLVLSDEKLVKIVDFLEAITKDDNYIKITRFLKK